MSFGLQRYGNEGRGSVMAEQVDSMQPDPSYGGFILKSTWATARRKFLSEVVARTFWRGENIRRLVLAGSDG
jgi:hypothetical protein